VRTEIEKGSFTTRCHDAVAGTYEGMHK
jgi:hypothetical protein